MFDMSDKDEKKVVVEHFEAFGQCRDSRRIAALEEQIERMKSDVADEIGFAKNFGELNTYNVLNSLLKRWEMKEND